VEEKPGSLESAVKAFAVGSSRIARRRGRPIARRPTKYTETQLIRKHITEVLSKAYPHIYINKVVSNGFKRGLPDIFAILDGVAIVIEAKKQERGCPTLLQELNLNRAADAGGVSLCVTFLLPYLGKVSVVDHTLAGEPAGAVRTKLLAALNPKAVQPAARRSILEIPPSASTVPM
jgi:hypothetical protein